MFQVQLMLKTETSTCGNSMVVSTNNGTSSTLKTGRVNQPPVNGTESSDSLLTKTSSLFHQEDKEDTLITSPEEIL